MRDLGFDASLCVSLCATLCFFACPADAKTVIDSVGVTVSDMNRSVDFYTHVLDFHEVADREVAGDDYEHLFGVFGLRVRSVRLQLGQEQIELMEFKAPRGRPIPIPSHSNDHWFQHLSIIVSDMDAAYARLRHFNVEFGSSEPQRLPDSNPNAGGIRAFYFHDPDGHNLEILSFPPDKGAARWHRKDSLFLGIDHSAIVVRDTGASLRFYRDQLGLQVTGVSDNFGTEQEHLNNVFGARLHITTLRPSEGPGVEFLQYVAPAGGRPMAPDTLPNDLWYWQINLRSSEPQDHVLHDGLLGWSSARLVQDPDGHTTLIEHP
jgi:catechol 2,3-dioxygenase-like lactoylglutathione lyase family enzyme